MTDSSYSSEGLHRLLPHRHPMLLVGAADVLSGVAPALCVPAIVVKTRRIVSDGSAPVCGMEGHSLRSVEVVERHPPVQLAGRRRIPSVAMRVKRGLPISFPTTTGVPRPLQGGRLAA